MRLGQIELLKRSEVSRIFLLVGVTGLEPATSRPPAVRATNCATPRSPFEITLSHFAPVIVGLKNPPKAL